MSRRLVVNADDFGFTRDVNRGIIEAHRHGILTSTTLMAEGAQFDDAVRLAREHPSLDIGVHGVLVQGPGRPPTVAALIQALALGRVKPYDELKPQVEKILAAGIRPTHFDTHKHTHLLPPVLDAVARLCEEYRIGWVRRPMDLPLTGPPAQVPLAARLANRAMHGLRGRFHRVLTRRGIRTTDHFAGFQITGRYEAAHLAHLVSHLPEGITEFMCHPGYCTGELEAAATRLKASREQELRALTDPSVRAALDAAGVVLSAFSALPQ
jgi:chitin disaccharide deacetylase